MCDWKKIITTKYTCKHVRWNEPNRSNDEKRNDKALPPHTKNTSALPHELNHQCSDCYHTYEQDACHYWWRVEIALSQEKMSSAFARQMLRGRRLVFVVWRTHGRSLCLFVAKMEPSVALLGARAFQVQGGVIKRLYTKATAAGGRRSKLSPLQANFVKNTGCGFSSRFVELRHPTDIFPLNKRSHRTLLSVILNPPNTTSSRPHQRWRRLRKRRSVPYQHTWQFRRL